MASEPKDKNTVEQPPKQAIQAQRDASSEMDAADNLPVVTRLVIEIRSDGTRTIARGAAEDVVTGERVAIRVEGETPLALALSLAKTLGQVPALAKGMFRQLLSRKG